MQAVLALIMNRLKEVRQTDRKKERTKEGWIRIYDENWGLFKWQKKNVGGESQLIKTPNFEQRPCQWCISSCFNVLIQTANKIMK